jgi:hypothetical protein
VRNFWLSAEIDGRKTSLDGGPRSKDGGMNLVIYQNHAGVPFKVLEVRCGPQLSDLDTLITSVYDYQDNVEVLRVSTKRRAPEGNMPKIEVL